MTHFFLHCLRALLAGCALGWTLTAAPATWPYPQSASKKGLQVQMVDDALELGVRHAALNFNFGQLLAPGAGPEEPGIEFHGTMHRFHRAYLEAMDHQIKTLSDHGVVVSIILLNYEPADPVLRRILLHPGYDPKCPNHLSAFNAVTPEGREWLEASMRFLAERWSRPDQAHGRVANWIVSNEVNSHWFWSNMGHVSLDTFVADHLQTVRLIHSAVRTASKNARVFLSLEHHWNIHYPGGDETQTFAARPFLEAFARGARQGGDFDWNIAFHPYPENLGHPQTWNDKSALPDFRTTPRITFKNIDQLIRFLDQPALQFKGQRRHVILSEQGFHTPGGPDGETIQAAAYCYAWKKIERLDGIDSFILHRHVDHAQEGGLALGLWTHQPGTIATPGRHKRIYDVFRAADGPKADEAFRFALPVIGIQSWDEIAKPK